MSMILNFSLPRGAATSTISPFLRPMIALPTGDSLESLFADGSASADPTMWYSTVLPAFTSRRRTLVPIETSPDLISFLVTTRAFFRRAPRAGVSVQGFRRQGRRFGAGLVCAEMVSCAGIEHRNERTLGYLRVGADEHPLAIQIFGAEPTVMAEAARMVVAAGADIVDMNFGCPVRKVTKTGAGAHLLEEPDLACRTTEAVAPAVPVPVTVKMRRGVADGSRACLELGPRLVEAGAAALALHPRSANQMYTGQADHTLTAELVGLVDVPVIASGDVTSREKALEVLEQTGAAAVMVARGAQGNPWALREIMEGESFRPTREEVAAELVVFIREAVRELGEQRAVGFLKKFYAWYLGHGRFPKPFKQELVQLHTTEDVVTRLFAAAPGAAPLVERLQAALPAAEDVTVLDRLPISCCGVVWLTHPP